LDWFEKNAPPHSNGGLTIEIGERGIARVHLSKAMSTSPQSRKRQSET
jgi:hypothetical protein